MIPLNLIKAGIAAMMDKEEEFIIKLAAILQEKPELLDILYSPLPPIDENVKESIKKYVKNILPNPENFVDIKDISLTLNHTNSIIYRVTYATVKYHNPNLPEYRTRDFVDGEFSIARVDSATTYIFPDDLI